MEDTCGCKKKKHREAEEIKSLINRLNRIEGQVRGVRNMIIEDCYCVDILTQISAIQSALNGVNKLLLKNHIETCVLDDIRAGKEEVIEELIDIVHKQMK